MIPFYCTVMQDEKDAIMFFNTELSTTSFFFFTKIDAQEASVVLASG